MHLTRAAADGYRKLRSSITISENLTAQRSLSGKEMRYSISNAIPHNPKSEKHPYENLVKSGFSGPLKLFPLAPEKEILNSFAYGI